MTGQWIIAVMTGVTRHQSGSTSLICNFETRALLLIWRAGMAAPPERGKKDCRRFTNITTHKRCVLGKRGTGCIRRAATDDGLRRSGDGERWAQACPGISSARPGWFGILKIARVMRQRRDGRNLTDCATWHRGNLTDRATWHRGDLTDCAIWHYRLLWNYGRQCGIINK